MMDVDSYLKRSHSVVGYLLSIPMPNQDFGGEMIGLNLQNPLLLCAENVQLSDIILETAGE